MNSLITMDDSAMLKVMLLVKVVVNNHKKKFVNLFLEPKKYSHFNMKPSKISRG